MRAPRISRSVFLLAAVIGAASILPAHAVTTVAANSTNTTDPATSLPGFPWNNVGVVGMGSPAISSSGIFLGDINNNGTYWVLTAYHVAYDLPEIVQFNGTGDDGLETYNAVPGSYVRLTNDDLSFPNWGTLSTNTDLAMFQIDVTGDFSNLVTLQLATSLPPPADTLYMVGYGGGTKRWGTNNANIWSEDLNGDPQYLVKANGGYGDVMTFITRYDTGLGGTEAQAIVRDSGGAVFRLNEGTYELTGVMDLIVSDGSNQYTLSIDISTYRENILAAAIPEPSMVGFVILGIAGFCFYGNRRLRKAA